MNSLSLPIYQRHADILASVDANQVTIITAETGAGKSTQVPQMLAEHGYKKIIVTQPRILAARNLSARVRQEYSWRMGKDATSLVGYRTANEQDDSPDNTILYCTDGLQLVRELTGSGIKDSQILVLDEVHEWNENMEVLIAWAKKRCNEDPLFRLVLMSATIETESLSEYFGAPTAITVPGRSFNVEKRHGTDLIAEIKALLTKRKYSILTFLPGKAEIENVAEALEEHAKSVPIIPLHSQLEPEAQQLAFAHYPNGKVILSTNVAQTSITIDDIDVVIDSGLERQAEVRNGVEGLFIAEVSQADCLQRAGRAGRTKEGIYVLAQLGDLPCSALEDRPAYGVPEIMRKHIDRLVLRLANIGIDIEDLEFYHSPSRKSIKLAKQTLVQLGALTTTGQVTHIGHRMERFPVESSYARMLVEADAYPQTVQSKLATIIAIQEVGGIVKGGPRYTGWRRFTRQHHSDLLAQYDVYRALENIDPVEFEDLGIIGKNVTKAQEVNERLHRDLGLSTIDLLPIDGEETTQLSKCIVAGQLHQLWLIDPDGTATHVPSAKQREISSGTVVKHNGLVVGTPFDLEVASPKGLATLHLVNDATAVDPLWLEELAPELYTAKTGRIYFDHNLGALVTGTTLKHGKKTFETAGKPVLEHTAHNRKLFVSAYSMWLYEQLEKQRFILKSLNRRKIPPVPLAEVQRRVREVVGSSVSVVEMPKKQRIELSRLSKLEAYLDERYMTGLTTSVPEDRYRRFKKGHRHKPPHKRKYDRGNSW